MEERAPVSYDELSSAYLWVSMAPFNVNMAFVSRVTGKIYWALDSDDGEELPEDIDDGSMYVAVPHQASFQLGRRLALDFAADNLPRLVDRVSAIFSRRGAFSRFKDLLDDEGCLEVWYHYEAQATESALREWSRDNGLTLVE